ncbi:MAG: SBBP repeat-containing protein [Blastocatellales bacterium]
MSFELNQGQADSQVKYLARGRGYQVTLTETEAVLRLQNANRNARADLINPSLAEQTNPQSAIRNPQSIALRIKLDGASPAKQVIGLNLLPGKSNYLIGDDPNKWHKDIPNYARVEYRDVYPGVSLVYYGTQRALEYDFIVTPGHDPGVITVSYDGADRIELDSDGALELHINGEIIYQRSPIIYQKSNGGRRAVTGRYVMRGGKKVGFEVEGYDASKPLVIDPVLEYATYLGGGGDDIGQSVKVDGAGNVYIAGVTSATDLVTKNAAQGANRGGADAFVAKLNASGDTLIYSTYLGGAGDDAANGIAVDSAGNAYVTGNTTSSDFNTRNPLQPASRGGSEAFVAKLSSDGSQLIYSTYLGSSGEDVGYGIAADAAGAVYVTGYTTANDFNTQSPLQSSNRGDFDAFVAKLNPAGSALSYSTYLGGTGGDLGSSIIVDGAGNTYVTGYTTSSDFNTKSPLQAMYRGGFDVFAAKINPAGSALVYSTYLGGADDDQGYGVAVDGAGNVYLTGLTSSADFPVKNALQPARKGSSDAFVTKINAAGAELTYSTYFGGDGQEAGRGIVVDANSNAYFAGDTTSTNFPVKNPLQPANRGASDAFIVKLNAAGSDSVFATYLGGGRTDASYGIAIDSARNVYVTGSTTSLDFNINNALQSDNLGGADAFVTKISADGSQLNYSTYLGGSGNDTGLSIAVDSVGNAYITGSTAADFEVKNPFQRVNRGGSDAFVAKLDANGASMVYATYFGGSGLDQGLDIAVDQVGAAYVTGVTASTDFSVRQPVQPNNRGGGDAFIAKLSATGGDLVYSTYFGGGGNDAGYSIAIDGAGAAYITGLTGSTNLPLQNPLQSNNRGEEDAFIAKINAAGSAVVYATYLGGAKSDGGYGIAVDASGAAYVAGVTASTDFNTKNALQGTNRGELDAFVAKISNDGSALSYSSYLGGTGSEFGNGIAVDGSGNVYVAGGTASTDFNISNPLQNENRGAFDAFVTKINSSGSQLVYSTYLGGGGSDMASSVAADAAGAVYLTGSTTSDNFPVKSPDQDKNRGSSDAFITTINVAGSDLVYSTYLGGGDLDDGIGIAIDGAGNIYVVGQTGSLDLPVANPVQPSASGGLDAFIVKIGAGSGGGGGGGGGVVTVASVSAASYSGLELAKESIIAAFGDGLATEVKIAASLPLPTSLAGTTVKVKDSAGSEREAPLFFVAPTQVNYLLPAGAAIGPALVTITGGDGKISSGTVLVSPVAPGLFSANADGQGVAAATLLRVKTDGTQVYEPVASFDAAQSRFAPVPIDLGPQGEQVFLLLFGTGLRGNNGLQTVSVKIGGVDAETLYLGAQGGFVGLDQGNVRIPRSLAGRGEVDVVVTVEGRTANTVRVSIK